jgi:branched-chain amino acid transport system permease protein
MIEVLLKILIFGAVIGGIWALVASGFSFIFGVARVLNFAHGTAFVASAYLAVFLLSQNFDLYTSLLAGVLFSGVVGVCVYTAIYRIREHEVMVIIVTLAIALLAEQILLLSFGDRGISIVPVMSGVQNIFGLRVTNMRILSFFLAIATIAALELFINRTRVGKMIMATSQDSEAAMLMGIDVEKMYLLTMFISSILAGIAGLLYAQIYAVTPEVSLRALIYAFAIVILGGLGSIRGSIISAFLVGYVIVATTTFLGARWSEFVMLLTIIAILIVRPTGLFGVEE